MHARHCTNPQPHPTCSSKEDICFEQISCIWDLKHPLMFLLVLKILTQLLCCEMWLCENLLTVKYEDFFSHQQWDFVTSSWYLYSTSCMRVLVRQHSASRKCILLQWAIWVVLHFYDEDGKIRFVTCFFPILKTLLLRFVPAHSWGILKACLR